jgi:hypothetical protein
MMNAARICRLRVSASRTLLKQKLLLLLHHPVNN